MATDTTPPSNDQPSNDQQQQPIDISQVLETLKAETERREKLEADLKKASKRETEFQQTLEKYKQIDPEKYNQMVAAEQARQEKELIEQRRFEELKTRYQAETESQAKAAQEWQERHNSLVVETAVRSAFFSAGGRQGTGEFSLESGLEDIPPVDTMLSVLKPRINLQDGKVVITDRTGSVELNKDGRPKSLQEKMVELRRGSMGALFEPENKASGGGMTSPTTSYGGKNYRIFSKEEARSGKASIDDIASGKAFVN